MRVKKITKSHKFGKIGLLLFYILGTRRIKKETDHCMNSSTDQRYLDGLFKKDKEIIKEIYLTFRPKIVSYLLKNSGTKEDAHDLFQVALEIFYHKQFSPDFTLYVSFYSFLLSICKNKWRDELKRRKIKAKVYSDLPTEEQITMTEELENWERHQLYIQKFAQLDKRCQKVLGAYYKDELSHKEIAKLMDWTEKYSKLSKHRCLEKLKQLIFQDRKYKELK